MATAYLNIGSNRGDRTEFIRRALGLVAEALPQALVRTSPAVESDAWGYVSDAPYLNVGVALDFYGPMPDPLELLRITQNIERRVSADSPHRNPDGTYRDRDIDIDIIDIDGVVLDTAELTIPHPRAEARAFVMGPMQFLCPGWTAARPGRRQKKTASQMGRLTAAEFRAADKSPIAVVLDNVRSMNNIGSIFRTADAFRVATVALCGITATPPHAEIHKTALGAEDAVAWRYFATTAEAIATLRAEGWTIACLEQVHGSVPLNEYRMSGPTAIVAGNEVTGVDPRIVEQSDVCVEIPQAGTKHSLNVSVSAAIAMWTLYEQIIKK